ncbi:unnamed protein product, partial [Nesidiocoris tenuis]
MSKATKVSWKCGPCKAQPICSGNDLEELFSRLETRLESRLNETVRDAVRVEITEQFSKLEKRISAVENACTSQESKNVDFQQQIDSISAELAALKNNLGAGAQQCETGLPMEEIMNEVRDRQRRACNLLIHDAPESNALSPLSRVNEDSAFVKNVLLKFELNFDQHVSRINRVGMRTTGKNRPLVVTFNDPSTVSKILAGNRARSPPLFKLTQDRTIHERQYLEKLRRELDERIKAGEVNLTIR